MTNDTKNETFYFIKQYEEGVRVKDELTVLIPIHELL